MIGLNGSKYSYNLPEWFAQHPGHFWNVNCLTTLLYFQDMKPNLTKQRFRRNRALKYFSKAPWAKWPEEASEDFMFLVENSVCYRTNASNLHLRGGSPYFPICCLINSFFHEQLLRQSVLIFFIYASIRSRGLTQFLFHEITKSWHTHQTIRLDELIWTEQVLARVMDTFVEFSINMFENLVFWTKCD